MGWPKPTNAVDTYDNVPRTIGLFFVRFIWESKGTSKN